MFAGWNVSERAVLVWSIYATFMEWNRGSPCMSCFCLDPSTYLIALPPVKSANIHVHCKLGREDK